MAVTSFMCFLQMSKELVRQNAGLSDSTRFAPLRLVPLQERKTTKDLRQGPQGAQHRISLAKATTTIDEPFNY